VVAGYKMGDPEILKCVQTGLSRWLSDGRSHKLFVVCGSDMDGKIDLKHFRDWIETWKIKGIDIIRTDKGFEPDGIDGASGYFPHILRSPKFLSSVSELLADRGRVESHH